VSRKRQEAVIFNSKISQLKLNICRFQTVRCYIIVLRRTYYSCTSLWGVRRFRAALNLLLIMTVMTTTREHFV